MLKAASQLANRSAAGEGLADADEEPTPADEPDPSAEPEPAGVTLADPTSASGFDLEHDMATTTTTLQTRIARIAEQRISRRGALASFGPYLVGPPSPS